MTAEAAIQLWRDPSRAVEDRVADLLARMTLEEKVAQLYSVWLGSTELGEDVVPHQHELADPTLDWPELIKYGLGQLTRAFGTAPVTPADGAAGLARRQSEIAFTSRFGIPAIAHEECLTGFMTWGATVFPTPLAWGATFDPDLVAAMAGLIGSGLRQVGVHQGLAPVLDVTRDPRWGRTEETIGEDPYLVGTIGAAYVRGLEQAGVVATLKHFVGYSGSRAGRNFGPVAVGPRELNDVFLAPFEMALREGGARSVMHSYAELDGVPAAASGELLTDLLRGSWGFTGTVVADYFGVSFLELLHRIAASPAEAAALALLAGVDVELPAVRCYGSPLLTAVRDGTVPESTVDRSVERVLRQKCELGLLDPEWAPTDPGPVDLDPPASRILATTLAEESVVLLANDGTLPLRPGIRLAVVGPQAATAQAMLGCYTFPSHVQPQFPDAPAGVAVPTLLESLRAEGWPEAEYAVGADVAGTDTYDIPAAVAAAGRADVCVVALGDRSGLFGRGTSGEGSDVDTLRLPGTQAELLEAVLATGTPVVLVLLAGRPYALGRYADRLAAVVQTFFPGQAGGPAVAGVLSGRVGPSGRLPIGVPRDTGGQPAPYLSPMLGHRTEVSSVDPTALYPFGYGLSYTRFDWDDLRVIGPAQCPTDGCLRVSVRVRNSGDRDGTEVVQLYLHDPVAQVTRPVVRLIGYARVPLGPGRSRRVEFEVPADVTAFTGRFGQRIVEPGAIELRLAASSVHTRHTVPARLTGPERLVGFDRRLTTVATISDEE